jgi:hypothetical protein
VLQPVGGEYRAEQAHADDDRQLNSDHGHKADHAGMDEGEADQPDGAQSADDPEDPVLAVAGHDTAGQPGADEPADAEGGEGEPVLPGREPELAQQEHSQQRLGGHDEPADEHVVEVERPQDGMGQDAIPLSLCPPGLWPAVLPTWVSVSG